MSTETAQREVVSEVGNPYLKKVHVNEQLTIGPLNGKRRICNAHDVFESTANFDPKDKHKALRTGPTNVVINLVSTRKITFKDMFQTELSALSKTAFEEDQIIELAEKYKHLLKQRGCIFALCHNGLGEYYISSICKTTSSLKIAKLPLDTNNIWDSHLYDYAVIKKTL